MRAIQQDTSLHFFSLSKWSKEEPLAENKTRDLGKKLYDTSGKHS